MGVPGTRVVVGSLVVVSRSVNLVPVNRWVIPVVLVNRGVSAVKGEVASAGGTTRYLGGPFVIHVKRERRGVVVLRSPPRPLAGLGMVRVRCG